jgi:hypothetical protein
MKTEYMTVEVNLLMQIMFTVLQIKYVGVNIYQIKYVGVNIYQIKYVGVNIYQIKYVGVNISNKIRGG